MNRLSVNFALLVLATISANVFSQQLVQLRLDKDGSVTPPGDLIHISVIALPGTQGQTVKVRAVSLDENTRRPSPIPAQPSAPASFQDANGNLSIETRVSETSAPTSKKFKVVFPYEYFELKKGKHLLYYEVEGSHMEEVEGSDKEKKVRVTDFVSRTRLTEITVEEGERSEMIAAGKPAKYIFYPTKQEAYTSVNGKLKEIEVRLEKAFLDADPTTGKKVSVRIPGKFIRTEAQTEIKTFVAASSDFEPQQHRLVYFATNRNITEQFGNAKRRYGNEAVASLDYGSALVNIPITSHKLGQLERGGFFSHDPNEVFLVETISRLMDHQFFGIVKQKDTLLYIHGFDNTFTDCLLGAAQLQHDIGFGGKVMAFSWPSHGAKLKYGADEKNARKSVEPLKKVLKELVLDSDGEPRRDGKVHVIAHSMGSRVLIEALSLLSDEGSIPDDWRVFGNVVFAAPDVALNRFASMIPKIVQLSESVTQYYSKEDLALGISQRISGHQRAGMFPFFYKDLHTINVDNANSPFIQVGHSYHSTGDRLLLDLRLQFLESLNPEQRRPPLTRKEEIPGFKGFAHYSFELLSR